MDAYGLLCLSSKTLEKPNNILRMPCRSIKELEDRVDHDLTERDSVINDLREQLTSLENSTNSKIEALEKRVTDLEIEKNRSSAIQQLHTRLIDDQNQYSRKTNLIFDGINIKSGDKDSHIRNIVLAEIRRLDLDVSSREVDRAHRTGRTFTDKNGKTHTSIIVRFTSWYARNCVYEARKNSKYFVKADITARRQDLLEWAREKRENDDRIQSLIQYTFADRNGHLSVKTCDNRYLKFNSQLEYEGLLNFIEDTLPPFKALFFAFEKKKKRAGDGNVLTNLSGKDAEVIEEWSRDPKNYYIGRSLGNLQGSLFQNPYSTSDYDRKTAIKMFREHILSSPDILERVVPELKNKNLGCFCWPEDCHGHVLLEILNNRVTNY